MNLFLVKLIFLILFFHFVTQLNSQTKQFHSISGHVFDEETGNPLPSVNVFLDATTLGQNSKNTAYLAWEITRMLVPYKDLIHSITCENGTDLDKHEYIAKK